MSPTSRTGAGVEARAHLVFQSKKQTDTNAADRTGRQRAAALAQPSRHHRTSERGHASQT